MRKASKENAREENDSFAKYTIKDSVFTALFQDKRYLMQLYRALHPEDTKTTEEELTDITIKNILANGLYNDLGFRVRDKVIILVESQSSWSVNIIIRTLLYLVQTWHDYWKEQNADLYGSRKIHVPEPELYLIYTGGNANRPETISLGEEYFEGKTCAVEVKVKVICGGQENNIIGQYITFTQVYQEQMKQYGRTRKAVTETLRICKDRNVLREFLTSREKEVISIMMTLFDNEWILQAYVANEKKEAAEKAARKAARKAAENMLKTGKLSREEIAGCFAELSVEDVQEIEKGLFRISR